ncbi:unnamed protein product [Closterium sp. Naga37s-1]|nr:unnamed protein product [Closterium sp. Naga37s-1]
MAKPHTKPFHSLLSLFTPSSPTSPPFSLPISSLSPPSPPLHTTSPSQHTPVPFIHSHPPVPSPFQDWFRSFHPQAFLFLRFEDYMANPRPHIAQTLDFLGFPAADVAEEQWAGIVKLERVEQRLEGMAREELDGVTQEYLEAFFAPFNADLVWLLRDEKYSWKRGQR